MLSTCTMAVSRITSFRCLKPELIITEKEHVTTAKDTELSSGRLDLCTRATVQVVSSKCFTSGSSRRYSKATFTVSSWSLDMEYNHMNVFWGFLKYKRVTGNTPDLRRHLQACTLDSSYVFIRNEVPPHKKVRSGRHRG